MYTSLAKSKFTLILIGIMAERSKKYLKNKINISNADPVNPLKQISIKDKRTIIPNKILL